jgi:hypothetical protein
VRIRGVPRDPLATGASTRRRRWDVVRKRDDTGKDVMTGEIAKDIAVVACIISVFLYDYD